MTLNEALLDRARATAGELAEAERQLLVARGEHHTAIRRLHLAGASLREIAEALALSHQRIQQIVNEAGGSWWRKAWRTRRETSAAICTWCGRPPSEVGKLVAGPDVYICDACVRTSERAVRRSGSAAGRASKSRCSFCRKHATAGRDVAASATASICTDCLQVCRDIMNLDAS